MSWPREDHSEFGAIIDDCLQILVTRPNFKVEIVTRQANLVTRRIPTCTDSIISIEMQ